MNVRTTLVRCLPVCATPLWLLVLIPMLFAHVINGGPALAADAPIEAFYGTYEGRTISGDNNGALLPRDLGVLIQPTDHRGFNVTWTTTVHKSGRHAKHKKYSIDFEPTRRPNIFGSRMQINMFGNRVPLDPLQGDPYIWARINARTLTVYALLILNDGSYEMQVYNRTLSDDGRSLFLEFSRHHEGEPLKVVTGTLAMVSP